MKIKHLLFCLIFSCAANRSKAQTESVYHDAREFLITGHAFKDATPYQRLPLRYKQNMRPYLWELSERSAGISVCFSTNSSSISVRWKTGNVVRFPHVAETLVKGVDLYGKKDGTWHYAGLGKPSDKQKSEAVLVTGMDSTMKEFILNLPMYETVDSVYIGVSNGSVIKSVERSSVFKSIKPVVFYGTSIVEGASAMRPGMAYPSIISRRLSVEVINLGFSGNALLDKAIGDAMAEIDALCYVMDCGPNLTPSLAKERLVPFIKSLKEKRPGVPLLLVENITYPHSVFDVKTRMKVDSINKIFKDSYATLKKSGMKEIHYLAADKLIGNDGEATVDGIHPTDLGFMRLADQIELKLRKILRLNK